MWTEPKELVVRKPENEGRALISPGLISISSSSSTMHSKFGSKVGAASCLSVDHPSQRYLHFPRLKMNFRLEVMECDELALVFEHESF